MRRGGVMTHCVGVLVVSELHQCRAVFRPPGLRGPLGATTRASLRVQAAACVLPHAARAAPATRWDVLLVGVCSDGCCSVLRQTRITVRKRDICLPSRSLSLSPPLSFLSAMTRG